MCLVFVSLNEHGVRSGIPAHASVRRPEVESGIHLVCLVFSGGSGPSDKGGRGGGAVVPGSSTGLGVSHQMHPNWFVCGELWNFFLPLLPQRQNVFFSRA